MSDSHASRIAEQLAMAEDDVDPEWVPRAVATMPETGLDVYDALLEAEEATVAQIDQAVDASHATVNRRVRDLAVAGIIEESSIGPPWKSGNGRPVVYWRVADEYRRGDA